MECNSELPIHIRRENVDSFNRLDVLWRKYPKYHNMKISCTIDELLREHESYKEDFDEVKEEYIYKGYEKFLVNLSWNDLPYRYHTKEAIIKDGLLRQNLYVNSFMSQFEKIDTDKNACFIFPQSSSSNYSVIMEVCKSAEYMFIVKNLFPDETTIHYAAVFDKKNIDDVILMFHLIYDSRSDKNPGGYSLYDFDLSSYQNNLSYDGIVLRSPYLPDRLAKYQGAIGYHHNPSRTVYVRRNISHIIENGYFSSELELFRNLTEVIMPLFQWWYEDISLYEVKDKIVSDWKTRKTRIRTELTSDDIISVKWYNEVSLMKRIRKLFPDTLYQYRPIWLGRQSIDLFIPSLKLAIEYQGLQHFKPVDFFGGNEGFQKRLELDSIKKRLCEENNIKLIEWPYMTKVTEKNIKTVLSCNGVKFNDVL